MTRDFPTTAKLEKAKPVFTKLPGWKTDIRGIKNYADLPENCRKYIEFVEKRLKYRSQWYLMAQAVMILS